MFQPIPFELFAQRSGIHRHELSSLWTRASQVVSLRELTTVKNVQIMPRKYLSQLLENVTLAEDDTVFPYRGCDIRTARLDPHSIKVGQTFIQRDKYQAFLENFQESFMEFCVTKGIAKCTALIAYGETVGGVPAIAHYLPPIVEVNSHWALLDGVHRNFLVKTVGTTLEAIFIENVRFPFPCALNDWNKVHIVSQKPPKEERFFDLKPEFFRDLKYIGIDG